MTTKLLILLIGLINLTVVKAQEVKERNEETIQSLVNSKDFVLDISKVTNKLSSNYLSGVSDLSFEKTYAVLDDSEDKLFIGGTLKLSGNGKYFLTIGAKANTKDGFASFFNSTKLNNDIGVSAKLVFRLKNGIYHNIINTDQIDTVERNRKKLGTRLQKEIDEAQDTMGKEDLQKFKEEKLEEFKEKEAEYIVEKKLYNQLDLFWGSVESYIPVSSSVYNTVGEITLEPVERNFYPLSFSGSLNYWIFIPETRKDIKTKYGFTGIYKSNILLSLRGDLQASNSILAEDIATLSFAEYQEYQPASSNAIYLVKTNEKDLYVGDYKTFWIPKLSAKAVYMYPFESFSIGARLSVEKTFGVKSSVNWKIGIPFSINNDNSDAKISFEILTQEQYGIHSTGINIGLPLSRF
jgi:hypothetical protein